MSVWTNDPCFHGRDPVALRLDPFARQAAANDRGQADGATRVGTSVQKQRSTGGDCH